MKFTLTRFESQEIEIDSDQIVTFPQGISPFDECTRYKFLHEEGKGRVFWLQSLDDADVVFSVADPALFRLSYEVVLTDEEQAVLGFADGDELLLAVILFRDDEAQGGGINAVTSGPVLINVNKRLGMQKKLSEFGARVLITGV